MPSPAVLSQNEAIFLSVLRQAVPSLRLFSDDGLIKKIGKEKFVDSCLELVGYVISGSLGSLSKMEQEAISAKLVKCLAMLMKDLKIPVTGKTLVEHFSLLEGATENNFPGYHESKLFRWII